MYADLWRCSSVSLQKEDFTKCIRSLEGRCTMVNLVKDGISLSNHFRKCQYADETSLEFRSLKPVERF